MQRSEAAAAAAAGGWRVWRFALRDATLRKRARRSAGTSLHSSLYLLILPHSRIESGSVELDHGAQLVGGHVGE